LLRSEKDKPSLIALRGSDLSIPGRDFAGLMIELLGRGHPLRFCAKGFSMIPVIQDGDILTVRPVAENELRTGMVVSALLPRGENIVVHRIIGRKGTSRLLKGDNSREADGFVPIRSILGRVEKIERNGIAIPPGTFMANYLVAALSRSNLSLPATLAIRRARNLFSGRRTD